MANFCSKCGAELSPDTRFCQSCGAPTGYAPAAAAPAAAVPAGVAPAGQVAVGQAPAASAPSSGVLKIVLIIVGCIVGLGMLSAVAVMFGLWRISKSVHVDRSGGMTITTPGGTFSSGRTSAAHLSEREVGAPIYPGAVAEEGGFKLGADSGSMATYVFKTSDSVAQVLAFYRDKFGPKTSVIETPQGGIVTAAKNDNEGVMVTVGRDENEDKTSIAITHTTSTKDSR
jgi:zinc-ribbon domain